MHDMTGGNTKTDQNHYRKGAGMKDYAYVVRSAAIAGREDEYNLWYSQRHLKDVIAVPGFISAQRFRLTDPAADGVPSQHYMAIYTMRTDDPDALLEKLRNLVETGAMEMSEALDPDNLVTILYEAITPVVTAHG
jgi:hypothetical protein